MTDFASSELSDRQIKSLNSTSSCLLASDIPGYTTDLRHVARARGIWVYLYVSQRKSFEQRVEEYKKRKETMPHSELSLYADKREKAMAPLEERFQKHIIDSLKGCTN